MYRILLRFSGLIIGIIAYSWTLPYLRNGDNVYGRNEYNTVRPSLLLSPVWLMVLAVGSFALTRILDAVLTGMGIDVNWSYALAVKACKDRKWVNPATSLSASYARISGLVLGRLTIILIIVSVRLAFQILKSAFVLT